MSGNEGADRRSRASGSGAGAGAAETPRQPETAPGGVLKAGLYVLLAVLGVLVAVAGALIQGAWFPGGLLLALAGAAALFTGGARAAVSVVGALAPAAAWLVTVIALSTTRAEGDFVFGAGLGAYAFLLGGIAVAVICTTASMGRPSHLGAVRRGM
ncbi:DUF6113 family protein [Streptomyces ochraceiscleroticus]|uniref:DUF6113 family protein n=1 Tax=Streptomyces ochraceiscleroticus TaxID=47761 RepID=A0ABW1MBB4_9ACTN|nr:DUF6113 family protein [Streptomyces ochraceiscleroticus]